MDSASHLNNNNDVDNDNNVDNENRISNCVFHAIKDLVSNMLSDVNDNNDTQTKLMSKKYQLENSKHISAE